MAVTALERAIIRLNPRGPEGSVAAAAASAAAAAVATAADRAAVEAIRVQVDRLGVTDHENDVKLRRLQRVAPASFSHLIPPTDIIAPGLVQMSNDVWNAFLRRKWARLNPAVAFVDTWGNDETATLNDPTRPFLTVQAAVDSEAGFIDIGPGRFAPWSYSNASPGWSVAGLSNNMAKAIRARMPGLTAIGIIGPELRSQTWTLHSGTIYKTTLAGTLIPERILDRDNVVDEFGYERQLKKYDAGPAPEYGSIDAALAALTAADSGWTWNNATRELYVKFFNLNLENNKYALRAVYSGGSGPQYVDAVATTVGINGLILDGITQRGVQSAGSLPQVYTYNCISQFANFAGLEANDGFYASENFHIHSSQEDCFHYFAITSPFSTSMVEINCIATDAGARDTFGLTYGDGTSRPMNRNGSSMHQSATGARFGGIYEASRGPNIADVTGTLGGAAKTWQVGVVTRRSQPSTLPSGQVFVRSSGEQMRTVLLDTCYDLDDAALALNRSLVIHGCTVYAAMLGGRDSNRLLGVTKDVGQVITAYDPRTPPA